MSANQGVQRTYWSAAPFKRRVHMAVACGGVTVEARNLQGKQELGKRCVGLLTTDALCSSECELPQGDGGDPNLPDRFAAEPLQYTLAGLPLTIAMQVSVSSIHFIPMVPGDQFRKAAHESP